MIGWARGTKALTLPSYLLSGYLSRRYQLYMIDLIYSSLGFLYYTIVVLKKLS